MIYLTVISLLHLMNKLRFLSPALARWSCFHPVCLFMCVCLCFSRWCHTTNILEVYSWGCLLVQVMFHVLVTSSMTSPGHKVVQILKLIYLRQSFSYSVDQKLKISEIILAILLASSIISGKKLFATSKWRPFWKFEIWNAASFWPQIWRDGPKLCQKSILHGDDVIDDVTGWPQNRPTIFMFGSGSPREQMTRTMSRQFIRIL